MITTCGIYLYSTLERKILLCHPTRTRWNNWSIPKGLPEQGENHLACAIRELNEETAIDVARINILKSLSLPSRKYQKQEKVLESILVVTDTDFTNHRFASNLVEGRDFPENDKWKWATIEESASLIHVTQRLNLEVVATAVL